MLSFKRQGEGEPALITMPFIGGSWHEYEQVIQGLHHRNEFIGIDLPGYGDSHDVTSYSVEEMSASVMEVIASLTLKRFVLIGHSMSGKVAAVLARYAADGDVRLSGLDGLVLIAPSSPSPDPIPDDIRSQLLQMFSGEPVADKQGRQEDHQAAEKFIKMNLSHEIPPEVLALAVDDLLLMNRAAWRWWWERSSREDWSDRVGVLQLPVLIVAGEKDSSLGPKVQKTLSMPHWANGRLESLNASHLIPLDTPTELARLIASFVAELKGK